MTDDDKRCPKCDKPMEWTITADARIWNCLESSCDDVAPVIEEGHFCPKCGGEMRLKYRSDGGVICEREGFGIEQLSPRRVCSVCDHEEKVR